MLKKSSPTYSPARFQSKSMMDLANTIKVIAEQGPPIPPASSNRPRLGGAGFSRTASNDPRQNTGSRAGQRTKVSPTGGYATYGIAIPKAMELGGNFTKEAGSALGLLGPHGNIVADALALGAGAITSIADLANKYGAGSASASKFSGPRGAFRGI
jgi:hypothetical protein